MKGNKAKTRWQKWVPKPYKLIGLVVFGILCSRIDLTEVLALFRETTVLPLLLGYFLFIPALLLRSVRWKLLLHGQKIEIGFWESLHIYSFSIFLGSVTPGRLGEFIKTGYLHKKGYSFGASFSGVFLDRFLDILFLLIAASIIVSTSQFAKENFTTIFLLTAGICLIGLTSLYFGIKGTGMKYIKLVLRSLTPPSWKYAVQESFTDFAISLQKLSLGLIFLCCALTVLAWGATYSSVYLFSCALGFDIPYFSIVGIAAISALVTLIPVTFMGVGTRDLVLVQMLAPYGIEASGAIAFSTLILSMLITNALICSYSLATAAGEWKIATKPDFNS